MERTTGIKITQIDYKKETTNTIYIENEGVKLLSILLDAVAEHNKVYDGDNRIILEIDICN